MHVKEYSNIIVKSKLIVLVHLFNLLMSSLDKRAYIMIMIHSVENKTRWDNTLL